MTVLIQILRVVCGLAAIGSGGWLFKEVVKDVLDGQLRFASIPALGMWLFALALIGSGLFNLWTVWS